MQISREFFRSRLSLQENWLEKASNSIYDAWLCIKLLEMHLWLFHEYLMAGNILQAARPGDYFV